MSGANKGFSDKERAEEAAWAKQQEAEKLKKLAKELASKDKKDQDSK